MVAGFIWQLLHLKTIFCYILPHVKKMSWGLFLKFIGTMMDLCIPWVLAYTIDNVIPKRDVASVYICGLIMLALSIIGAFTNILANRNASAVGRNVTYSLRNDLYTKINMLSSSQIDHFTIPSLISRLTTDTHNIHRTICVMQKLGVRAPILFIGGIVITMSLDYVLTLTLIVVMPFILICIYFISKKGVSLYMNLQKSVDNLVCVIRENITGVKVIKSLSKSEYERDRFDKINRRVSENDTKANIIMGLSEPIMYILFNCGLVLVVIVGAYRVDAGKIHVGVIVAFLTYFIIILNAMKSITKLFILYFKANASAIRISEVLNTKEDLDIEDIDFEDDLKYDFDYSKYHIEFKNVTFSYNENKPVLKNISFELNKGESLGIIGAIGSGKSTILLLLMGFYKVDSGEILINGVNIDKIDRFTLRSMFGVVFQNDYLFSTSIKENIDLDRNLSDLQIEKAAICARAVGFINEKKARFDEKIFKSGGNLSGGQKQRIFLSRAFALKPEILLLDDSSSALDFKTDLHVRESIFNDFTDSTKILIDSRINSIKDCSKILVLQDGIMMGYGTHEELLNTCSVYCDINEIQNY